MNIKTRLEEMGYEMPQAAKAVAAYVPFVKSGAHLFISGQIPFLNGQAMHQGILGKDLEVAQGQEAAKACALNILAQLNEAIEGDLSRVKRCVKLGGFVACVPEFIQQPQVINGASELIAEALGEIGQHARSAVGVPSLPLNCAVEVDAIFEIE